MDAIVPPDPASQDAVKSIPDLFRRLGGNAGVADALGVSPNTAGSWRKRLSIPVEHWPAIMAAAARKGLVLDADALLSLHAQTLAEAADPAPRDCGPANPGAPAAVTAGASS